MPRNYSVNLFQDEADLLAARYESLIFATDVATERRTRAQARQTLEQIEGILENRLRASQYPSLQRWMDEHPIPMVTLPLAVFRDPYSD